VAELICLGAAVAFAVPENPAAPELEAGCMTRLNTPKMFGAWEDSDLLLFGGGGIVRGVVAGPQSRAGELSNVDATSVR
jgi:hypothetical protein